MNPMDDNRDEEQIEAFLSAAARTPLHPMPPFSNACANNRPTIFSPRLGHFHTVTEDAP